MERAPRMVIDAQKGKKPEKRETLRPVEAEAPREALDVRRLQREQREALATHLANVDAVDVAFENMRLARKDLRDARKSGDPVWLGAAVKDDDRANERWQEAKAVAKASRATLGAEFDDVEFGRKDVRGFLRVELAESQKEFEASEAAQETNSDREVERQFVAAADEAARQLESADNEVHDASMNGISRIYRITEILEGIHVPGVLQVREAAEDWRNYLQFAMAGVEDATAAVRNVTQGGQAEFSDLVRIIPTVTEQLEEAQMRLVVAQQKAEEVMPRIMRVDTYLIGEYAGDHSRELSGLARSAQEIVESAQAQLRHAISAWQEATERPPQQQAA